MNPLLVLHLPPDLLALLAEQLDAENGTAPVTTPTVTVPDGADPLQTLEAELARTDLAAVLAGFKVAQRALVAQVAAHDVDTPLALTPTQLGHLHAWVNDRYLTARRAEVAEGGPFTPQSLTTAQLASIADVLSRIRVHSRTWPAAPPRTPHP
jgi:hypothetical protein